MQYKKKAIFLCLAAVMILSICFTACAKEEHVPALNRKMFPGIPSSGVISYGLFGMDGEIEKERHFQIDSGDAFEKILAFDNLIEYRREYKLLIFANYRQTAFSANHQEGGYSYDFTAEPYEQTQCTISLPQLADGFYDLLFVIVKDPNNSSLDEEYRKQTDLSHMTTMRYSLQVGSSEKINDELPLTKCDSVNNHTFAGAFLNDERYELRRLLTLACEPDAKPELFIHIGNLSDETKDYVVLILYDWMQTPIDSQMALRVSLPGESRSSIGFIPESLGEIGVHNMTAICVESPYQTAAMTSRRADFSIRIGVNVRLQEKIFEIDNPSVSSPYTGSLAEHRICDTRWGEGRNAF